MPHRPRPEPHRNLRRNLISPRFDDIEFSDVASAARRDSGSMAEFVRVASLRADRSLDLDPVERLRFSLGPRSCC